MASKHSSNAVSNGLKPWTTFFSTETVSGMMSLCGQMSKGFLFVSCGVSYFINFENITLANCDGVSLGYFKMKADDLV